MLKTLRSLTFKRGAAISVYAVILIGSSIPGSQIPEIFQFTPDKLIHCAEYFTLGFMIMRWANAEFALWGQTKIQLLVLLIGAVCGMTDELYQNLIPNRSPDIYDWYLDLTGIILSMPAFSFWKAKIFQE